MFGFKPLLGLEPMAPIRPQLLVSHANHSATETSMYACMNVCMYCVRMYICMNVCMSIKYTCVVYIYVRVCVRTCIHLSLYLLISSE